LQLPIEEILPAIREAMSRTNALVVEAPPGAGKTTRVPRALLDLPEVRGEIVVLEPRRLAAKMAARRVAEEMGERVGETVGFAVRFEEASSARTRIRFVTEGVLLRRAQQDPTLSNVGAVILDEFHERHVHADVALALVRHLQRTTRPDLRVIVMSATLDAEPVSAFLGCARLRSEGRSYAVTIEHQDKEDDRPLSTQVAAAVRRATRDSAGDVLVFLPGAFEIKATIEACASVARDHDLSLLPLYGELSPEEQERAIKRSDRRKVVVSTNVAESSLTIDGVTTVIDSGLVKRAGFAPWSGLPTLRVEKASRASLAQRTGRAGRTRDGHCVRLFTKADEAVRAAHETPELLRVDLTQTLLELASSGLQHLEWLDAPLPASVARANELLFRLGGLDASGAVTALGREMARLPVHPRLGRIAIEAATRGVADDGTLAAAILGERDFFGGKQGFERSGRAATQRSDVMARIDVYRGVEASRFSSGSMRASELDAGAVLAVQRAHRQLRGLVRDRGAESHEPEVDVMISVLAGFVDRVARRVRDRALALGGGGSAELSPQSSEREAPLMVAVLAEQRPGTALVRIASAIEPEWLIDVCPDRIEERKRCVVSSTSERVMQISQLVYDGLVLEESTTPMAAGPLATDALVVAALAKGARSFAPPDELDALLSRARFAREVDGSMPELGDDAVRAALVAMCEGATTLGEVRAGSLVHSLRATLGASAGKLERLAPERVTLAAGRSVKVNYEPGKPPWIASRLQDFFGMKRTPAVGDGRVPLVVHLLAPNQRAVQVTSDLEGFWTKHYPEIRKQLARRYPRHAWPESV